MTDPIAPKPFDPKPSATREEILAAVAATPAAGAGGNLGLAHARALIAHLASRGLEITLKAVAPPVAKPKVEAKPFFPPPPPPAHSFEPPHIAPIPPRPTP